MKIRTIRLRAMTGLMSATWFAGGLSAADSGREVSLDSLVQAMTSREELARFPSPPFRLCDQSSYGRKPTTPDDAEIWFANHGRGNFLRVEEKAGRKEWVLMETTKPGVITRVWMADQRLVPGPGKQGVRLLIRLDGAEDPVIGGRKGL